MICLLLLYATSTVHASLGDVGRIEKTSACYNDSNVLDVYCPEDSIIAVSQFYIGFRNRTCNTTLDDCCSYREGDCLKMENNISDILVNISGRNNVTQYTRNGLTGEYCKNNSVEQVSTYNQLEYLCINNSRIKAVSENVSTEGDPGDPIYLYNIGYPNPSTDQANYTCSVEANAITTLKLYVLHIDLQCNQTIDISDGDSNSLLTMNCTTPNFGFEKNLTTTYIKFSFTNDGSIAVEKFWLGFRAADAGTRLKLRCPAVAKELFKDCSRLENPNNGTVHMSGTNYSSVATYACLEYYTLTSGNFSRTCLANGSWSGEKPVCSLADVCEDLTSSIDNGQVVIDNGKPVVGSIATYSCNKGYTLIGGPTRTCQETTGWSGEPPICDNVCEDLPSSIDNGQVVIDNGKPIVGSIATYRCNKGYTLSGGPTRTCQETTGWSGEPLICFKNCDHPEAPENGNMSLIGSGSTGTVAIFTCNNGYSIHGSQRLNCREDSTWSDEQPGCLLAAYIGDRTTWAKHSHVNFAPISVSYTRAFA